MNEKETANLSNSDIDLLNEFEGIDREIARDLLSYRQPASLALRQRVMDITRDRESVRPGLFSRWDRRSGLAFAAFGVTVFVLLFAFPQVRAAAAQLLLFLTEGITGVSSTGVEGVVSLSPAPPFTVRQPGSLPEGFVRTAVRYRGATQILVSDDDSNAPSNPALAARMEVYDTDESYLLIGFQHDMEFMLLFQTAADGATVPAGSSFTIDGQPASLQSDGDLLTLTWIVDGTRIVLEGSTTQAELVDTAQELLITDQPDESASEPTSPGDYPLCNGETLPSQRFLLGELDDQVNWGTIWISHYDHDANPPTVATGINTEGVTQAMLVERGLETLRDPLLDRQVLTTPPNAVFELNLDQQCLEPASGISGYVVLEVWEDQVNVGFHGITSDLRDRAIDALEAELSK